jgi:hypothetical protein
MVAHEVRSGRNLGEIHVPLTCLDFDVFGMWKSVNSDDDDDDHDWSLLKDIPTVICGDYQSQKADGLRLAGGKSATENIF